MKLISKNEVMKEMEALPAPLTHDFYFKEVKETGTVYHPATLQNLFTLLLGSNN